MPQTSGLRKRNNVRFQTDAVNDVVCNNKTKTNPMITTSKGKLTRQISVLKVNKKLGGSVKKKTGKKVVFNGTFPIDDPISSRFDESESESDVDDDDDDDNDDDDEQNECCDRGVSIEELIVDRKVKLNYNKMMNEYERSFAAFDQLMATRNLRHLRDDFNVN